MSDLFALLVNSSYEPISFLHKRVAMRLMAKDKVDVIETWADAAVKHGAGAVQMPAVIRLKKRVPSNRKPPKFKRKTLFERDDWMCQYCGEPLTKRVATIDHLVPRCVGGRTSWGNCVTACAACNRQKGHQRLSETAMALRRMPSTPTAVHIWRADSHGAWHSSWENYFGPHTYAREEHRS